MFFNAVNYLDNNISTHFSLQILVLILYARSFVSESFGLRLTVSDEEETFSYSRSSSLFIIMQITFTLFLPLFCKRYFYRKIKIFVWEKAGTQHILNP